MAKQWEGRFTGKPENRKQAHHANAWAVAEPYRASEELIRAVNLSIHLGRPLLIEGEAGCGKTRLAHAVAYELGLPLEIWQVDSKSRARDGLYVYDSLLRLHDVQMRQAIANDAAATKAVLAGRDPSQPAWYYEMGPLGRAFALTECPAVVLIDEIDKADLEFPNDLLTRLDRPWQFTIPEVNQPVTATHTPIVIITSNKEKGDLPHPFLRRCVYFYLNFPDDTALREIIEKHYPDEQQQPAAELIDAAIDRFGKLRKTGNLAKKPGASEFLDWMTALHQKLDPNVDPIAQLKSDGVPPYPELLYKLRGDWPFRNR